MYRRILVTLDGSNAAEMVLPYAEQIAAKCKADIVLVTVSDSSSTETEHLYLYYLEHIMKEVKQQLNEWGTKGGGQVTTKVLLGKPADEILQYADKNDIDLIAMTSRGRSEQGPWLLGNIAAKVLRATSKPVLLIRASATSEALQQRSLVKKILLPLDGSRTGEAAIPFAESLAEALGAELIFFQAVGSIIAAVGREDTFISGTMLIEADKQRQTSTLAYLNKIAKPIKAKGISTSSAITTGPQSPADQIIDYANANAIDLIAVSTHGRSGIGRWVFGDVTDKILHAGDKPVLTVRAV
jgi:nucleotide-binding universal stress UspA family protein